MMRPIVWLPTAAPAAEPSALRVVVLSFLESMRSTEPVIGSLRPFVNVIESKARIKRAAFPCPAARTSATWPFTVAPAKD